MDDGRLLRAFLLAPLVGPVLVWLLGSVLSPTGEVRTIGEALQGLAVLMLFGAPVAYGAALLVGVPVLWWFRRTGHRSAVVVVVAGALGAMAVVGVLGPSTVFFGQRSLADFMVAGSIGAAAGAAFWWLGIKPTRAAGRGAAGTA